MGSVKVSLGLVLYLWSDHPRIIVPESGTLGVWALLK